MKMNMNMNMNMNTNINLDMGVNPLQQQFVALPSGNASGVPTEIELSQSQSSTMGELIFDKFINHAVEHPHFQQSVVDETPAGETHDISPKLFNMHSADPTITSTEISTTELNASIVENFFDVSSSTDSTPIFELDNQDIGGVETWTSLFDNDIPVTLDDIADCANAASLELESSLDVSEQQQPSVPENSKSFVSELVAPSTTTMNSLKKNQFLPTPMLEDDLQLPSKPKVRKSSSGTVGKVSKPSKYEEFVGSPSASEAGSGKYDDLGVIAYSRKQRAAPLTPVIADSDDPMVVKRAKNTEAARRSRARKLQRMNQLEDKVKDLLQRNTDLENEVHRLRSMLGSQ
ncbi:unnamed protein product [Kluyveromyces dobzhanskii CBS 2104]|uniref:WGS project CCBQ000000000 data, contig 00102 n=1 Tax=Kluyveromyces dobzhanskii CBS 2104 TaxID=1427455 RepID=A0A0A8L6Z7_9SACH|nr:unnamed protein product [Kluyveromyces dobzhanskii CBS 2104]